MPDDRMGPLFDVRIYPTLLDRSTHTIAEIAREERRTGRAYIGSCDLDGYLVPVFSKEV